MPVAYDAASSRDLRLRLTGRRRGSFEPGRCSEPLEDLAGLASRRLAACQLGVLEQRDAEHEWDLELAEETHGELEAGGLTRHAGAEAMRLRLEIGRPRPRRQTV